MPLLDWSDEDEVEIEQEIVEIVERPREQKIYALEQGYESEIWNFPTYSYEFMYSHLNYSVH